MKRAWGWLVALYLFLGGIGGALLAVSAVLGFTSDVPDETLACSSAAGVAAMALGCLLLLFDLGQKRKAPLMFSSSTAIIKWGGVLLALSMACGAAYTAACLPGMPGSTPAWAIAALAIAGAAGFGVCAYTGVLLAGMKARPFWRSPAIPVAFTASALLAAAAVLLAALGWPLDGLGSPSSGRQDAALGLLRATCLAMAPVVLASLLLHLEAMARGKDETARSVARRWISGPFAPWFWAGIVVVGLALPFCAHALAANPMLLAAAAAVSLGCDLLLRCLVLFSDDRPLLPGERAFRRTLPHGDETFLHAWEGPEERY